MITYNDLYEILRKEKYSESLQQLSKDFLADVALFFDEQKKASVSDESSFLEGIGKSKKQLENSIALFKELILRRKRKLLNLILVATETGIMKRDYENMLSFEREMFDILVKTFEEGDKSLARLLHGSTVQAEASRTMILITQNTEQFVDMNGSTVGPFSAGELVHLDAAVCSLLVSSGKANYVDEK